MIEVNKIFLTECSVFLSKINEEIIDLTITSPPYFNVKQYSQWTSYSEYLSFLKEVFFNIFKITKKGRMCCVNISSIIIPRKNRNNESKRVALPYHFVNLMEEIGWKFIEDIIWVKPDGASKNRNGGFFQHRQPVAYKPNVINEFIFVFQKPAPFLIDNIVRSYDKNIKQLSLVLEEYERTNVWKINPQTSSKHLAPYPLELADKIIRYYSFFNDLVLDPFMGSGTTAVSCKKLGRKYIGCEIHSEYVEMAEKRINEDLC